WRQNRHTLPPLPLARISRYFCLATRRCFMTAYQDVDRFFPIRTLGTAFVIATLFWLNATPVSALPDWFAGPLTDVPSVNGADDAVRTVGMWDPDGPEGPEPARLVAGGIFTT